MKLWRASSRKFADLSLSGEGAKRVGSRWTSAGHSVVYSADSKSAALLEFVAMSSTGLQAARDLLTFVRIDVPDRVSRRRLELSDLPAGWNASPATSATRTIGDAWLSSADTCVLKVPSALVPGEATYLLNPLHRDFEFLVPHLPEPYDSYDAYADEVFATKEVFLCHASEDKEKVVRPLRDALFDLGVSCWLDEAELTIGDSITEKVNVGLGQATFVVVVISPAFMRKNWPQRELRAALNREARQGFKVVLPIVLHYPGERVHFAAALPIAEDKLYFTWRDDPIEAAKEIEKAVRRAKA